MQHSRIGKLRQWIKLAYLHGVLEEETYMEQPEGFVAKGDEDKVCRLMCSLYRLKQAGCVWNRTFAHRIKRKLGFDTIHSDAGVYILHCHHKRGDSEMDMILILYVDDLLLLGEDLSKTNDIKHQLGKLYQMKDLSPASSYWGFISPETEILKPSGLINRRILRMD